LTYWLREKDETHGFPLGVFVNVFNSEFGFALNVPAVYTSPNVWRLSSDTGKSVKNKVWFVIKINLFNKLRFVISM
jgi:hypothetical protein